MQEDAFIVSLPVRRVLRYIARKTRQPLDLRHPEALLGFPPGQPVDWHLLIRQGLRQRLHLNLGIPGIELPQHPIEEHPAALYAAIMLGWEELPVILSGEIELAVTEGLAGKKALSNLRNAIRNSV
jgi:hypothetical protein